MDKTQYRAVYPGIPNISLSRSLIQPRMGGRTSEILLAFFLMTIPMSLFSALLLGLVFYYQVDSTDYSVPELRLGSSTAEQNVIYVDISATTLTTVASWSSTIAPILVGSAITLISYPVSKQILKAGERGSTQELPTPWQLGLMLKMIASGGPMALWNWLQYAWGWRGKKEKQGRPMKLMTVILVLALALSTLVFAADTWFHFTTKSVNLSQVYPVINSHNTSVGLLPACYNVNTTFQGGCTLNSAATAQFLINGAQAQEVVSNLSATMRINTLNSGSGVFTYVGTPPRAALASVDYKSHSWSLKTQCTPITTKCIDPDNIYGAGFSYKCPFAMEGRISTDSNTGFQNQFKMTYFTNSSAASNYTGATDLANPYHFAAIGVVNQNIGHGPVLSADPEILSTTHGADLFVVFCNTTVYDVSYVSLNGSVTSFDTTPANRTLTNIVQGSQQYTRVGDPSLIQGASIAAFVSSTAQGVADYFALTYSQVALGIASAAFVAQPAVASQTRITMLVARVPVAPLTCLLIANLSLALLGVVLVVLAGRAARGEAGEVQARLSVAGLVAAHFEGRRAGRAVEKVEDLFEERDGVGGKGPRVGVARREGGGWGYSVWGTG
ncbi:hypothetical protein LZ554_007962 [Drepanopeziza brunnea f. sp. 'monogermtubi']|nr:hypothetical protein LZ554_007962 [Drepanopeziza brunnea f. sp. 'monogermtubi']